MSVTLGRSDFLLERTVPSAKVTGVHESLLQEGEKDIIWYKEHFIGKPHMNFLAIDSPSGALAVSIIFEGTSYRCLVRSDKGSERFTVPTSEVPISFFRRLFRLGPSQSALIQSMAKRSTVTLAGVKLCKSPNIPNELLSMEERQVIRSYKFGLAYLARNQSTEDDMFSNRWEDTSDEFKQFLSFIGEKIELKGWKGYRAGLDVEDGQTGTYSIYNRWQGYEIMFHVSPFLPYNPKDKQHLDRKRHIGNDIVVIVFQDSPVPYQMESLTSKQNHILAFIHPIPEGYKLSIVYKNGVPPFAPDLPEPSIIGRDATARDYLFHKLVNGERASYKAPSFAPKLSRTRGKLLRDVAEKYLQKK